MVALFCEAVEQHIFFPGTRTISFCSHEHERIGILGMRCCVAERLASYPVAAELGLSQT